METRLKNGSMIVGGGINLPVKGTKWQHGVRSGDSGGFKTGGLTLFLVFAGVCYPQVLMSGTFRNPDGYPVNGRLLVKLSSSSLTNSCSTPAQVIAFRDVQTTVSNGILGSLSLYASSCLVPQHTPTAITGAAAGRGATVSVSGTNLYGTVTLHTGSGLGTSWAAETKSWANTQVTWASLQSASGSGVVATLMFGGGVSYAPRPLCIVSGITGLTYLSGAKSIQFSGAVAGASTYLISYSCAQNSYAVELISNNGQSLYRGNWIVPNAGSANVTQVDAK